MTVALVDLAVRGCARAQRERAVGNGEPSIEETLMLWTLAIILLVLWALGFVAFHVGGGLIHLLLVIALIVIVYRLVTGRRPVA
jgi:hypothetical protein